MLRDKLASGEIGLESAQAQYWKDFKEGQKSWDTKDWKERSVATSSDFTIDAKKFERENPSIELINHKQLSTLFNERHGPYWIYKIDS